MRRGKCVWIAIKLRSQVAKLFDLWIPQSFKFQISKVSDWNWPSSSFLTAAGVPVCDQTLQQETAEGERQTKFDYGRAEL